ncbi:unnamed protein product [Periconia digitata]|uniref:CAF1-domain-containing protein n=1 Tax=Periconia digitata TaxID=1303443 RepID=A0A9W4XX51_9PLEO|nr:unnamed protein product [Periconia digitata]
MDVTASSFSRHLLRLLDDISKAEFVAFDLELSGIPSHLPKKTPTKLNGSRKTLEDRYAETKKAADRYQILQVGLTCGSYDMLLGKYVVRPYNVTLSPLLKERLDIEREIHIQSGAASFLLENGFDLGAPFAKGVQYLSREEAEWAKQAAFDRHDGKTVIEDVQLKPEEVDSIDFVRRAREAITNWVKNPGQIRILHITSHTGLPSPPQEQSILRFEKRLVHQLVRADFPQLVTIGNKDFSVRVVRYNAAREEENTRRMKNRTMESISRQTGFRWVFEALAKGDISATKPSRTGIIADGQADDDDKITWDLAHAKLQYHQPVLVGHNMFTDLVYFYRSFVGELPETLDSFCEAVHKVFPRIIDTKWLATYAGGDLNDSPSLQKIAESMENQELPSIATHHEHSQYHDTKAFHEAGFDSLLTATIMLQISAKLHHEQQVKAAGDANSDDSFKSAVASEDAFILDGQEKVSEPVSIPPLSAPSAPSEDGFTTVSKKEGREGKAKAKQATVTREFPTYNRFNSLDATGGPTSNVAPMWQDETDEPDCKPMEMIPSFHTSFWTEFGNTLRVFGTDEKVLKIADWPEK